MITDQIRQQENYLDARMKAKMVELCFHALMDTKGFEKRFKQLPEEQQDTIKDEFSKFVQDLERIPKDNHSETSDIAALRQYAQEGLTIAKNSKCTKSAHLDR